MNVLRLFKDEETTREAQRTAPEFAEFWGTWPRKVAKRDAEKAWSKLTPADKASALEALPLHVKHWRRNGTERQYIPHPATWLNGGRWEDEIEAEAQSKPKTSGQQAWWISHIAMDAKGREMGVGSARAGETTEQYRARIQAAIDEQLRYGGQ
jgi:hypothetical protein